MSIARSLCDAVDSGFGFKINLDYLLAKGISGAIGTVKTLDRPVFADLKMWNGGRTMSDIANLLVGNGADVFTVHTLAGGQLEDAIKVAHAGGVKVYGTTVLTHYTDGWCIAFFKRNMVELTAHLTSCAIELGLDGVIVPGTMLKHVAHMNIPKICPGIRFRADARHPQAVSAGQAKADGATHLVIGAPIMQSVDPVNALQEVIDVDK